MIASQARIEANRRNAREHATGPKTQAGKEKSRANALKHGLCSTVVLVEDARAVEGRSEDLAGPLRPLCGFEHWLVKEAALLSLRIERCEEMERLARDRIALRAELTWDGDRKLEATLLGGKIGKEPEVVVERLRATPQGCDWLMARWALLANQADEKESWTPEQARLAFDLLGTPADFRDGNSPGVEGRTVGTPGDRAALARREIAALEAHRERVEGLDEADRSLARSGMVNDSDPQIRRLRRYESSLHRRLQWCLAQLDRRDPAREPSKAPETDRHEPPAPRPRFDRPSLEPPAIGRDIQLPVSPGSRLDRKLKKAEARRDARLRKLEKLRA